FPPDYKISFSDNWICLDVVMVDVICPAVEFIGPVRAIRSAHSVQAEPDGGRMSLLSGMLSRRASGLETAVESHSYRSGQKSTFPMQAQLIRPARSAYRR